MTRPETPAGQVFEIDLALLEFASRFGGTPLKRDLLALFGENPHLNDTAEAIARLLARAPAGVARELEDLRLLGLLRRVALPRGAAYRLTDDPDLRAGLKRFLENYRRPAPAAAPQSPRRAP